MPTVGALIRARRRELGLTLAAIAGAVGCAKGYLSMIENERRANPPSRPLLEKLERALRMRQDTLVSVGEWQETPEVVRRQVRRMQSERLVARRLAEIMSREGVDSLHRSGELRRLVERLASGDQSLAPDSPRSRAPGPAGSERPGAGGVELLGVLPMQAPVINKVAAGYPREFTDMGYPARIADDYVSVPDVYDADAFAARVVGDSMTPGYHEGDIVVFSPAAPTPAGSDCFVRLERDAETTFKRIYFETSDQGRELIRLQPLNPAYSPKLIDREEVAGLYAAVYVVRKVGG